MATAFHEHQRPLAALARSHSFGAADGDDVVQEVFLRLIRDPRRFVPERGELRTYLRVATRGAATDVARTELAHRARLETSHRGSGPTETRTSDDEAVSHVVGDRVRALLASLPPREREAISLAFFEHRSYREVAALLGETEGTTKARIRSGLRRLRSALQADGYTTADVV